MKRVVHHRQSENHLSDMISRISNILICDDVTRVPVNVTASSDNEEDEQFYLSFTDEQLLQLDLNDVRSITNLEVLDRIYRLAPYKLTAQQIKLLRDWYKNKLVIDRSDVAKILELLKQCNSVSYYNTHRKTNQFARNDVGELRESDCLEIIHQLTIEDYVANSRSINLNHLGNNIIIFEPDADWEMSDGTILSNITLYVKIDLDETSGTAVALVSFHDAEFIDPHPYADEGTK